MKLSADVQPDRLVALIDSREQKPLDLTPLRSEVVALATGDYSLRGLEAVVAVERKSLTDLLGCIGRQRTRFEREVHRLLAYPVRALVIEASWAELEAGGWRSEVRPETALGSLLGWIAAGLPVIMAGDRERAGKYVARLLYLAARRRWREARTLVLAAHADEFPEIHGKAKIDSASAHAAIASPPERLFSSTPKQGTAP
jgi:ERCC4-type nuclease